MFSAFVASLKSLIIGVTAVVISLLPHLSSLTHHPSTSVTKVPSSSSQTSTSTTSTSADSALTSNWSGYVTTKSVFTGITGSWTVPSAIGSGPESADATWIGIGGVSSSDLIQVGTQNTSDPNGQMSTSAFYEMLPADSVPLDSMNVNPGDSITASIIESPSGLWTISLRDNSDGNAFSQSFAYSSSESSAEWIEEAPSNGQTQVPLDDFGSVTFTDASTIINGQSVNLSQSGAKPVIMLDSEDQILAAASAISSNGSSFTVARSAVSEQYINQYNSYGGGFSRQGFGFGR